MRKHKFVRRANRNSDPEYKRDIEVEGLNALASDAARYWKYPHIATWCGGCPRACFFSALRTVYYSQNVPAPAG
jgi:hypothetical protein